MNLAIGLPTWGVIGKTELLNKIKFIIYKRRFIGGAKFIKKKLIREVRFIRVGKLLCDFL